MRDFYIEIAKNTVEMYVKTGKIIPLSDNLPKGMLNRRSGVFVSIHKILKDPAPPPLELKRQVKLHQAEIYDGIEPPSPVEELRGCIGTYLPVQPNIAQEIVHNAIEAATQDPRFPQVTKDELPQLIYSVDILSTPEPVQKENLDPKKFGIIVQAKDGRRGLLLPDLLGVETVDQQIAICRQKAWINEGETISLFCFTVERHEEEKKS